MIEDVCESVNHTCLFLCTQVSRGRIIEHLPYYCVSSNIKCIINSFCVSVSFVHSCSKSYCSGVRSTMGAFAKNWLSVNPNVLHMASNVGIDGKVFRWKILLIVDGGKPDSFTKRYSDQLRCFIKYLIFSIISKQSPSFHVILVYSCFDK